MRYPADDFDKLRLDSDDTSGVIQRLIQYHPHVTEAPETLIIRDLSLRRHPKTDLLREGRT
ncbi:protein of unknown function [Streptomyces murinus]